MSSVNFAYYLSFINGLLYEVLEVAFALVEGLLIRVLVVGYKLLSATSIS